VRAFASAVIAGIILLFSAGSAQAAFPGKNGLIAYERGGGIWLMKSDGSSKHQIRRVRVRSELVAEREEDHV
jgi:hypothetical protein